MYIIDLAMNIRLINYVQTRYSDIVHRHTDDYEFHYCVSGTARFRCMEREMPFVPGTVVFVPPGHHHQVLAGRRSAEVSFYYCIFSIGKHEPELTKQLLHRFSETESVSVKEHYRSLFERIRMKRHAKNPLQHDSAAHLLLSFIYDLLSGTDNRLSTIAGNHVARAIQLMQRSVRQELTLDDLAEALDINKFYLVRLFKKQTGLSPMKYFVRLKIDTACYLLAENARSIGQIADELGFYDAFHFSRVFKQLTGVSPGRYRQQGMS
jgi:AraC-like DNA-binding protein